MALRLLSDRDVDCLLYEVLDTLSLHQLSHFAEPGRATDDLVLPNSRRACTTVASSCIRRGRSSIRSWWRSTGNAVGMLGLTAGAVHPIESCGSDKLREECMPRLSSGE